MTPSAGATTINSIFIASSTTILSPASTRWPGSTATCHTLAVIGERTASQPSGMPAGGAAVASSGGSTNSGWRAAVRIPHLNRAPYKLIASRTFHAVNAEVGSPDPDGVLRCPRARRVVLRGHQAVPRIQWRCDGRPKIHVSQSHHEITRVEHDVPYVFNRSEPVDAADELDVARTPRCIRPHRLHVLANSKLSRRIIPG